MFFTKLSKMFRRFVSVLFSRAIIVGVTVIAQIVWLWLLAEYFLEEESWIIKIITAAIGFILWLVVINKDEVAEYKLPWLLVIAVSPLLGIILFIFFGNNQLGRRMFRRYDNIMREAERYFPQKNKVMQKLKEESMSAYTQAAYLYESSFSPVHENGSVRYFPIGDDVYHTLIDELKQAKEFIFIEYFIIGEGKFFGDILNILKEKVAQGVEVRLMYDDIGSIGKVPVGYARKLRKYGLKAQVFRPFLPIISTFHNNRDHRKITVIDNRVAFTGGLNLSDEYVNVKERFGRWKDNVVMVTGECVPSFTALFLTLWDFQARKVSDYDRYVHFRLKEEEHTCEEEGHVRDKEKKEGGYVCFFGDGPNPCYPQQVGKNVYMNILGAAERYVYITTPYIVCDNEILSAIRLAARRGVDVRMIVPKIPDKQYIYLLTRANYGSLIEAGVKLYEYTPGFIHSKTFICDDKIATVTTINLDYRSLVHHFECGLWMYGTPAVADAKRDFLRTEKESEEMTTAGSQLTVPQSLAKSLLQIITPLL